LLGHHLAEPPHGAESYLDGIGFEVAVVRLPGIGRERHCPVANLLHLIDRDRLGERTTRSVVAHELGHAAAPFAQMASAASRIVAKVPSERSSESKASKPSLPRANMCPRQVRPSHTLTSFASVGAGAESEALLDARARNLNFSFSRSPSRLRVF